MGSISTEPTTTDPSYTTLSTPLKGTPAPVILFFSFLDATSHSWACARKPSIANTIRRHLPHGTSVHRYHVSSIDTTGWSLGAELTRAWAVAMHLGVDDKVIGPLFEEALVKKSLHDLEGIREVFARDGGVDGLMFDEAWVHPEVLGSAKYQEELSEGLQRENVPCVVVGGRYALEGREVERLCDDEGEGESMGRLVRGLVD